MRSQTSSKLWIDTSLGVVSGADPSSSTLGPARTSVLPPGSSKHPRSVQYAQQARTTFANSTSSATSRPSRAIDDASAAVASSSTSASHTAFHAQSKSISASSGSESEDGPDAFTYVLAMHDYSPPSSAINASTCLSFRAGQVIRLYNRDPSGWWDGEVDSRRGWFPSNYVTADVDMLKDEELPGILRSSSRNGHAHNMSSSSAASWTSASSTNPTPATPSRTDHRSTMPTAPIYSATTTSSSDVYCPPLMVPLLHAISLLTNVVRDRHFAHLHPATACIVTCVRAILTALGCLQRDAQILKTYLVLARERKRILADLGAIVESAKMGSSNVQEVSRTHREEEVDGMLNLAGQLFTHIRSFLAVAVQCGVDVRPPSGTQTEVEGQGSVEGRWDSQEGTLVRTNSEQEVGNDSDECAGKRTMTGIEERSRVKRGRETTVTPSGHLRAKSLSDLSNGPQADEDPPGVPTIDGGGRTPRKLQSLGRAAGKQYATQQTVNNQKRFVSDPAAPPHAHHRSAQGSVSSISSTSSSISSSSGSSSSHETSTSPSFLFPTGPTPSPVLLAALRHTHDTYLSTIAAFIGHAHSHSRTSHASSTGHMYDLVREVVEVVCKLLTIVDAVLKCEDVNAMKKPDLRRAKDGLYEVTSVLADAVRKLTTNAGLSDSTQGEDGEVSEEEEKAALLRCATNALKAGADCVGAVKKCMQRAGGDRPLVVLLPDPVGEGGMDVNGAYVYTPSKFSAHHQYSRSQSYTKPVTPVSHSRSKSALQHLRYTSEVADGEDEDLTIQAQTVSFNVDETPGKPEPVVPEEQDLPLLSDPKSESETAAMHGDVFSDAEDEHHAWSSVADTKKPLPPLQIAALSPVDSRPPSPVSATSLAPTDDGTTWEGVHSTQNHHLPLSLQDKLRNGELPPVPDVSASDFPQSQSDSLAWLLSHDYPAEDVAYNSEGQLVGATLEALVERMTPHNALVEPAFAAVFFMTFRQFTTPAELVETLIARYNIVPPPGLTDGEMILWQRQKGLPVRLRVSNFVKSWLENYWRPSVDNAVLPALLAFTRDALAVMCPIPGQRILALIQTRTVAQETGISPKNDRVRDAGFPLNPPSLPPSEMPRPIMTKPVLQALRAKNYTTISVTDFDAMELARQLTTMECTLYCAILPEEILETGQSGAAYPSNVKAVTSLSTVITGWVAESILNEPDTKKRTALVKFFIKIADRCVSLQNFSTPRSILAALDSSTISRLHQTWTGLPQKNKLQLEALRKLADHARNYHEYRTRLRNTAPPAVPFLGLYLTDITFCREGNPSHRSSPRNTEKKLLNFNKYHKLARIVQDMQRFQAPYNLKVIPEVQDYLTDAFEQSKNRNDLQDLYRRSLLVEPRRPADTPPTGDVRQLFQWATRSQPATATSTS